jgi:hypothetical protein
MQACAGRGLYRHASLCMRSCGSHAFSLTFCFTHRDVVHRRSPILTADGSAMASETPSDLATVDAGRVSECSCPILGAEWEQGGSVRRSQTR